MQTPSLTYSLRCTLPTDLTQPLEAHPAIIGGVRELVEQMVGRLDGDQSSARLSPVAWKTCQIARPELAKRIHRIGIESLHKQLPIGPVWQEIVAKPLLEDFDEEPLQSPDEPLPLDVAPEVLVAAQRSRDVVVDVLMGLNRLREDSSVQDCLRLHQGRFHPDMDALWSNILLALLTESVTSPFGEAVLEAMAGLELPLAHGSDGVHPLIRLLELGVSESLLRRMVEIQTEPLPPIEPRALRYLLSSLFRKQMWNLLGTLRHKGWDGQWNTIVQDLPAEFWNRPGLVTALERLADLGLELESLTTRQEGGSRLKAPTAILRILFEGSEALWGERNPGSNGQRSIEESPTEWERLWQRLAVSARSMSLSEWLHPKSRIVSFLSYQNRLMPLNWLLNAGLESQISLEQLRWPTRVSLLSSGIASLLLHHGGLREDPRGLEVALRLNALSGEPLEERLALLEAMKQRDFCRPHLAAWERYVHETVVSAARADASLRVRLRAAHQVLEESWATRHARLNGAVVFAFAISQILCRTRVEEALPSSLQNLQRHPIQCLSEEGLALFKRAWRESIHANKRLWLEAQSQALSHWVTNSPLDSVLTSELVQLWLDVLCARDAKTPPHLHLPEGGLIPDDLDWAIEQIRRTLVDQVLA